MRKLWIIGISVAIFGALFLMEFYTSLRFPVTSYEPEGLPTLPVGVEHEYDFLKDGERVGSYVFWIENVAEYEGKTAYFSRSTTSVVHDDKAIELETLYAFDEDLKPLEYRLNATLGDERQFIVCFFDGWNVSASIEMEDSRVENDLELPVDTVLIDTNMLGHWELLFKSFNLEAGKRISFNMFRPQILNTVPVEFIVDKGTKTLTLSGVAYECEVVRASDMNLTFYLHNGDVVKLEESKQNIEIILVSG